MVPQIHTMEKCDFLKSIIHSQTNSILCIVFPFSGLDHEFDLGFSALSMNVTLVGNIGLNIDKFTFSVEVKLCSSFLKICLPNIEVLTNIEFDLDPPNISMYHKSIS